MDYKAQRDRFMAFSFASADLLLETDKDGVITFAIGAASPFGRNSADALHGVSLNDLLAKSDHALVDHFVRCVVPGQRFGPVCVRTAGDDRIITISGCTLPGVEHKRFLSIAQNAALRPEAAGAERDERTGMVAAGEFENVASDTLTKMKAAGVDAQLTFVTLQNQPELLARLEGAAGDEFLGRVGAILRAASVGDAATQVADGRYGILQDARSDGADIERDIEAVAKEIDPTGEGVDIARQSMDVDDTMSTDDAVRALVYTINTFAGSADLPDDIATMSDALEGMVQETGARIASFKSAIAERRIGFVAQPVVDLSTRATSHYEVLVRFEPGKSPFEVVSFAEKTGVIAELDMAVFEVAAAFLTRSAAADFPGLAINLSGLSIVNPAFATQLYRKLVDINFPRDRLVFEITESAEISDLAAADETISKLRKFGHHVCLDDFGAGAASFPYLRALDVDCVKIDGDYVRQAAENRRDALLLKAMAGLCRDLQVTTIAEMVETEDQVRHLQTLGIDKGQGYLFGRPEPLAKLAMANAA